MSTASVDAKLELLARGIAPRGKLLRTWPLGGGSSAEMTACEIEHQDGRVEKFIVRRPNDGVLKANPDAAAHEFELLKGLRSMGLATPEPRHFDASREIFATPYLVADYIDGEPDFALSDINDGMFQLATHLAKIHQVDGTCLDLSFLPQQSRGCIEISGTSSGSSELSLAGKRIRDAMISLSPLPRRNAPVLLHGDYWPGNILWRDGELVAVIDWEDARLGDPLIDLGISRLDVAWIFGLDAMHAFTEHYKSLRPVDDTDLPYWDLCAALRLVRLAGSDLSEWVAFFIPFGRSDITVQTMTADYRHFISLAFDKLASRAES